MDLEEVMGTVSELGDAASPLIDWASANWMPLVLTGEIVGAVVAIKLRRYYRGVAWLLAALMTIWLVRARWWRLPSRTVGMPHPSTGPASHHGYGGRWDEGSPVLFR